jgi:PadR family transcriptional regulator PadR
MTHVDASTLYGTLNLLVLRTLEGGPLHGLEIRRRIVQVSREVLQVEEGALYPALHRLERDRLVRSSWGMSDRGRRAKFYALTADGRARLARESRSWRTHVEAVARVLEQEPDVSPA